MLFDIPGDARMRLLFIQGGFGAGGAEKVLAMIAAHRAAQGDDVTVLGFSMPESGSYFPYPESVRLIVPEAGQGSTPLQRLRFIRKTMRDLDPNYAISFLTKINVLSLLAAMGLGVPLAISERNNPQQQKAHPVWRWAQERLGRRAAAIVMQTERARADLTPANRRRAAIIPNPCSPVPVDRTQPSGRGVRMVAIGRLDRQKGFDLLLEAMPAILAAFPDTRLTIYGEGPERAALENLRAQLKLEDIVHLPGASARPGAWMETADLLVFPSRFEGFPNVVAEATVSGLPVVAADCKYGPRELIRQGENGLLVRPEDPTALAEAVIELIGDEALRTRMSQATEENIRWLAPDQVLAQWDDLIDGFRSA